MTAGGENGNAPLPRLEGLGKGGGDCSAEEGEAVGTLDSKMMQQRWRYVVAKLVKGPNGQRWGE